MNRAIRLLADMDLVVLHLPNQVAVASGSEVGVNVVTTVEDEGSLSATKTLPSFGHGPTLTVYRLKKE